MVSNRDLIAVVLKSSINGGKFNEFIEGELLEGIKAENKGTDARITANETTNLLP